MSLQGNGRTNFLNLHQTVLIIKVISQVNVGHAHAQDESLIVVLHQIFASADHKILMVEFDVCAVAEEILTCE